MLKIGWAYAHIVAAKLASVKATRVLQSAQYSIHRFLYALRAACLAVELLPLYEQAAKERMLAGKVDPTEKFRRLIESLGHLLLPRYVSDTKKVKEEAPFFNRH